jgi:pilus assembly protein CpaE
MSSLLRVCLYNTEPEASEELRTHINALNFIRLTAEVNTPENLANVLQEGGTNLVFFHLDPKPDAVVEVIDQVSSRFPELALIAISHESGPDAILAPMRAGCDQFVCEPIVQTDLATAVSRVASKRLLNTAKSRCICVTGASGGVGTTSIASNLAMEIGQLSDRDCGLVDLDFQFGDLAVNFDCEPKYTVYDLASSGPELDRSILTSTLTTLPCKAALLARPEQINQHETLTPEIVTRIIDLLTNTYENVVIDVPRRVDRCTLAAFRHSDIVLMLCQLLVPSIRNAKRYLDALVEAGVPPERVEVVVNRGDSSGGRITMKDLEETIKKPVYACVPNDYQFVARSIDFGKPIAALERSNPVRTAIRKMAVKIIGDTATEQSGQAERRGFLGRLLSK